MEADKKAKLGQRWVCFSCGARFYDLHKPEPLCPKCQTNQLESPLLTKPKRVRKKAASKPPARPRVEKPRPDEEVDAKEEAVDFEELDLAGEELGDVALDDEE
jgi:hypothetical protein